MSEITFCPHTFTFTYSPPWPLPSRSSAIWTRWSATWCSASGRSAFSRCVLCWRFDIGRFRFTQKRFGYLSRGGCPKQLEFCCCCFQKCLPHFSIYLFLAINVGLVIIPIVKEFAITAFGICICAVGFAFYFLFIYPNYTSPTLTAMNGKGFLRMEGNGIKIVS